MCVSLVTVIVEEDCCQSTLTEALCMVLFGYYLYLRGSGFGVGVRGGGCDVIALLAQSHNY
jgi:hypothetical protein